jgi:hypothetical protein
MIRLGDNLMLLDAGKGGIPEESALLEVADGFTGSGQFIPQHRPGEPSGEAE